MRMVEEKHTVIQDVDGTTQYIYWPDQKGKWDVDERNPDKKRFQSRS